MEKRVQIRAIVNIRHIGRSYKNSNYRKLISSLITLSSVKELKPIREGTKTFIRFFFILKEIK